MLATTSPVARTAAKSTSITGRTSRTCTGKNADGEVKTYAVGQRAWSRPGPTTVRAWCPASRTA